MGWRRSSASFDGLPHKDTNPCSGRGLVNGVPHSLCLSENGQPGTQTISSPPGPGVSSSNQGVEGYLCDGEVGTSREGRRETGKRLDLSRGVSG